ncbi:MAG TPA: GNAT family N-acetyltransferase [Caulobacter sp.]|nr:GNAT family N-acetyltransferase [Caulobacter sp.]
MTPTTIRRLQPGEGPAFQAIRLTAMRLDEAAFGSTLAEEEAKPAGWFEERVVADGVFVAEVEGRIVGVIAVGAKRPAKERHKGVIYSMFVLPEGRGRGLGGALMAACLDYAREVVEIVQLVVVSTNSAAVALYEGAGFERYGFEPRALLQTDGRYTDDLHMWKRLR